MKEGMKVVKQKKYRQRRPPCVMPQELVVLLLKLNNWLTCNKNKKA
jgi:hypothetical protein